MSQVINELATIDVSNEVLEQLNLGSIYQNFSKNYQKLDDLKNFRSNYEKDNRLTRWWHNDKLRDAQLDSAEVQAEFSKTIGQLMMISIMQSKRLAEQQTQLNGQQGKLKVQADGIAEHASELQKQHHVLADQSAKLENLVHDYFALKGLTEEGAQNLIDIANEVKATKDGMLQAFAERAKEVEVLCGGMTTQLGALSAQVGEQIRLSAEQTEAGIAGLQRETRQVLATSESALRGEHQAAQQLASQNVERLGKNLLEAESGLLVKIALLESSFSSVAEKQKANQEALICFQHDVSRRIKRLGYLVAGLSVCVLAGLGGIAHLLKLI
ncbi:MAG TPA: hypothetical protein DIS96_05500 [Pusillimonas sp.]|nr:hypothetical protein [Pusillimonas sp.]